MLPLMVDIMDLIAKEPGKEPINEHGKETDKNQVKNQARNQEKLGNRWLGDGEAGCRYVLLKIPPVNEGSYSM